MISLLFSAALAQPPRVAVIITGNRGVAGEVPLRFADTDGRRVSLALEELGGFLPDHIIHVEGATREGVDLGLGQAVVLASRLRDQDELADLLVYYAGHAGADGLHLDGDVLPIDELKAAVRIIPAARRVYVIDACRSGHLMRSMGATLESVTDGDPEFDPPEDEAWIASTGPEQDAFEADRRKGALFSHFFVSGLRGSADADRDLRVTLREVYAFAQAQTIETAARTGRVQEPRWAGAHGDWPVSNLHRAAGGIVTAGPVPYDLLVVEERTSRVAAEIPAGSGFRIALPRGRYQLIALDGDTTKVMYVDVAHGFQTIVPDLGLQKSSGIRARGGLLVRSPWTVHGGYEIWSGGLGARQWLHGPWLELLRELGSGQHVGARLSGSLLGVQGEWVEGFQGATKVEATWMMDLDRSPWSVGPMAHAGVGLVQQSLRRKALPGLDEWFEGTDGSVQQRALFGSVRAGVRVQAPMGPVSVHGSTTLGSLIGLHTSADWRPGVGVALGVSTRP